MSHVLDNPIWESLISRHRGVVLRQGEVARYPAQVAPFMGVPAEGVDDAAAIEALVPPGDTVLLLDRTPVAPPGWRLEKLAMLAQMVCESHMEEFDGSAIIELSETHRADVLALTALVYPHYFRPHTMDLGRYFGIYEHGRLAAMIGERMGMDAWQEISAVCTHPDFNGRGLARRLLAFLTNDNLARGRLAFLHVAHENARAKRMYEQGGYRLRRDISFWSLKRATE